MVQHYGAPWLCEECWASRVGDLSYANALANAPWCNAPRACAEVIAEIMEKDKEFPLLQLGWHNTSDFEDFLHDDLLGLRQHMNGGVLHELCREQAFGAFDECTTWRERLDSQLREAFRFFSTWTSFNGLSHSQPPFNSWNLSMKKMTSEPVLKSKAKNGQVVSAWLTVEAAWYVDTTYNRVRASVMKAFDEVYSIVVATKYPNWRLSESQASDLEQCRMRMLLGYHFLAKKHAENASAHFSLVPKFHKVDHLLRRAIRTRVSPSLWWTFSLESHMGIMARMVHKLHASSSSRRGIERWLLYFFSTTLADLRE